MFSACFWGFRKGSGVSGWELKTTFKTKKTQKGGSQIGRSPFFYTYPFGSCMAKTVYFSHIESKTETKGRNVKEDHNWSGCYWSTKALTGCFLNKPSPIDMTNRNSCSPSHLFNKTKNWLLLQNLCSILNIPAEWRWSNSLNISIVFILIYL